MSAGWINAHVTVAPYTYPHWYGGLGPGDIIADEVTRRLGATTAPWGSSNTLLSWFTDDSRIQRVHLLDRGDFTATPVLCVYLAARNHLEAPGSLDVNTVRLEIAVVAETASLAGVLTNGSTYLSIVPAMFS